MIVTPPTAPPTMAPIGMGLELAVNFTTEVAEVEAETYELLKVLELVLGVMKAQNRVRLRIKWTHLGRYMKKSRLA
jgi:hypothetical protein